MLRLRKPIILYPLIVAEPALRIYKRPREAVLRVNQNVSFRLQHKSPLVEVEGLPLLCIIPLIFVDEKIILLLIVIFVYA